MFLPSSHFSVPTLRCESQFQNFFNFIFRKRLAVMMFDDFCVRIMLPLHNCIWIVANKTVKALFSNK